jgi:hypothetical protein
MLGVLLRRATRRTHAKGAHIVYPQAQGAHARYACRSRERCDYERCAGSSSRRSTRVLRNYYFDNEGCQGPTEYLKYIESRNEEGSCIADQFYLVEGGGYTKVTEECNGLLATIEITIYWTSFPKCWNRGNNIYLIRCRRH